MRVETGGRTGSRLLDQPWPENKADHFDVKSTSGDRRAQHTGRGGKIHTGPVIVLPKSVLDTDEMRALPASATKLRLAVLPQYNGPGRNNGAIRILMRQPRRYGFTSADTLTRARDDLLRAGFLQITRQGGTNMVSLYALTWMGIDPVPGIDIKASPSPSHLWQQQNAHHRELPIRGKRKPRALNPPKNAKPAPVIGATGATTAPFLGTRPSAIAPVIGAVRPKTGFSVAPVFGTDSCVAMHGSVASLGSVWLTKPSLVDLVCIDRLEMQPQHRRGENSKHGQRDARKAWRHRLGKISRGQLAVE